MAKRQSGSSAGINMQDLARAGAQARLAALRAEQDALIAAFPDLRSGSSSGQARATQRQTRKPATRGRRGMSPAQRKAVGERMRAYWAARRAEKSGSGQASGESQGGATAKARSRKRSRSK